MMKKIVNMIGAKMGGGVNMNNVCSDDDRAPIVNIEKDLQE